MASAAEQLEMDLGDQPTPEELEALKLSEAEANKGTPSPEELAAQEAAAKKAADDAAAAELAAKVSAKKPDQTDEEARSLRALAREQKRELDRQNIELEKMRRQIEKAGLVDEEDKKAAALEDAKAKEVYENRMSTLTNILETMKVNPKFEDVEVVVSQDHFDDLVEAMAKAHVAENGGSERETAQKIEQWIWGLPNPYQYAYDRIKQYHPAFRKAAAPSGDEDAEKAAKEKAEKEAAEKLKKGVKKIPEVAPSIAAADGASSGPGGWTAAMIEAMEEEDLPTVPKEIYNKYLLGDLK
jgi:hypothetical protein